MDLADLHVLDAVASRGSFTGAAAQLRLSQPAVSARIAAVERAIGATLFTRDTRGARLTPAGQRYLGYVRRCLQLLADGARAAAAERPDPVWTVGVPASYSPALAPILVDAAAQCGWPLTIRADHSRELTRELLDGRLDIAISTPGAVPDGLVSRHLLDTPLAAVARQRHRDGSVRRYAVHSWHETADAVITDLLGRGVTRSCISVVSPAAAAVGLALGDEHLVAIVPELAARAELAVGALHEQDFHLPKLTVTLQWLLPAKIKAERTDQYIAAVGSLPGNRTAEQTR
jgi:DNA-binding transcriptional LysR family regulator